MIAVPVHVFDRPTEKKEDVQKVMKPESCLLIPKPIPRGGIKPKTTKKATVHVLVEFGLLVSIQ